MKFDIIIILFYFDKMSKNIINNLKPLLEAVKNEQLQLENKNIDDSSKLTAFINVAEKNPDVVFSFNKPNDHKQQVDALKKFKKGQMSYSEMRLHCG